MYAVAYLDFSVPSNSSVDELNFAASVQATLTTYMSSSGNQLAINLATLKVYGRLL